MPPHPMMKPPGPGGRRTPPAPPAAPAGGDATSGFPVAVQLSASSPMHSTRTPRGALGGTLGGSVPLDAAPRESVGSRAVLRSGVSAGACRLSTCSWSSPWQFSWRS